MAEKQVGQFSFPKNKNACTLTFGGKADTVFVQDDGRNVLDLAATKLAQRECADDASRKFLLDLARELGQQFKQIVFLPAIEIIELWEKTKARHERAQAKTQSTARAPEEAERAEISKSFETINRFLWNVSSYLREVQQSWRQQDNAVKILFQIETAFPDFVQNAQNLGRFLQQFGTHEIARNFFTQIRGFNLYAEELQLTDFNGLAQAEGGFGEALKTAVVSFFAKGEIVIQRGLEDRSSWNREPPRRIDFDLPDSFKIALGIIPAPASSATAPTLPKSETTSPAHEQMAEIKETLQAICDFLNRANNFWYYSTSKNRSETTKANEQSFSGLFKRLQRFDENLKRLEKLLKKLKGQPISAETTRTFLNELRAREIYTADFAQLQQAGVRETVLTRTIEKINDAVKSKEDLIRTLDGSTVWGQWSQAISPYAKAPQLRQMEIRKPKKSDCPRQKQAQPKLRSAASRGGLDYNEHCRAMEEKRRSSGGSSTKPQKTLGDLLKEEGEIQAEADALERHRKHFSAPQASNPTRAPKLTQEQLEGDFRTHILPVLQASSAIGILSPVSDGGFFNELKKINIITFIVNIRKIQKATPAQTQALYRTFKYMFFGDIPADENFGVEIARLVCDRLKIAQGKCSEFQNDLGYELNRRIEALYENFPRLHTPAAPAPQAPAMQEEERIIRPRDPEIFLNEVFDWIANNHNLFTNRDQWFWHIRRNNIGMKCVDMDYPIVIDIPLKYIDEGHFSTEEYEWQEGGEGINNLIEKFQGKRVFSRVINGEWFLEVVKPQAVCGQVATSKAEKSAQQETFDISQNGLVNFYDAFLKNIAEIEMEINDGTEEYIPLHFENLERRIRNFPQFLEGLQALTPHGMNYFCVNFVNFVNEYTDFAEFQEIELPKIRKRLMAIYQRAIHERGNILSPQNLSVLFAFIASIDPYNTRSPSFGCRAPDDF